MRESELYMHCGLSEPTSITSEACRFADLPITPKWPMWLLSLLWQMWQMWQVLPRRAHGDGAFNLGAQFCQQLVFQPAAQAIQLGA
jgi:hypothetical protein